jgi:hypothetical protein
MLFLGIARCLESYGECVYIGRVVGDRGCEFWRWGSANFDGLGLLLV